MQTSVQTSRPPVMAGRPIGEITSLFMAMQKKIPPGRLDEQIADILQCSRELEMAVLHHPLAELSFALQALFPILQMAANAVQQKGEQLPPGGMSAFLVLFLAFRNALRLGCRLPDPQETMKAAQLVIQVVPVLWGFFSMPGTVQVPGSTSLQLQPGTGMLMEGGRCVNPALRRTAIALIKSLNESFFPLHSWQVDSATLVVIPKGDFVFGSSFCRAILPAGQSLSRYFLLAVRDFRGPELEPTRGAHSYLQWGKGMSLLLNGHGVAGFTNSTAGQLLPATDVTHLLKPGVNMLQVEGSCAVNYIVAVVTGWKMKLTPELCIKLMKCIPSRHLADGEDNPIRLTLPYRISLKDPISGRRLKVPIRTWKCRHVEVRVNDPFKNPQRHRRFVPMPLVVSARAVRAWGRSAYPCLFHQPPCPQRRPCMQRRAAAY
eukprot:jgi/Mesvir1/21132/Mv08886-RA.2